MVRAAVAVMTSTSDTPHISRNNTLSATFSIAALSEWLGGFDSSQCNTILMRNVAPIHGALGTPDLGDTIEWEDLVTLHRCSQCTAPMRTDYIGALSDKVLRCDHCGAILDIPDESTVEQSTTTHEVGPGRTVTTTRKKRVTRRDGLGGRGGAGDTATFEIDLGNREQATLQLHESIRHHVGDGVAFDLENLDLGIRDFAATEVEIPDELLYQLRGLLREGGSASLDIGGLISLNGGSGSIEHVVDSREITISRSNGVAPDPSPGNGTRTAFAPHGRATSSAARRHRTSAARSPLWMVVVAVTVVVIIAIAVLG